MGLFDSDQEDKTETATAFRREEFRKQGQVAISREGLSVILLLVTGGVLAASGKHIYLEFILVAQKCFSFHQIATFEKREFIEFAGAIAQSWGWMFLPIAVGAVGAGILGGVAQVGFYFTTEPLSPKWERLDPFAGFGRLFSSNGAVEAVKAVIKVAIVATVVWSFLKGQAPVATTVLNESVQTSTVTQLQSLMRLFFTILAALGSMAGLDWWFQRWTMEKKMRMTKREAKEEFKMREGDPLIKSRIRSIQRRLASRRMMEEVPKADVVITNPTHFAVALKYDSESMRAPRVIAKGAGVVALKIKEMARLHRVPVVENKPLARALFRELDIGEHIPRELYKAVAEVLAYVYRLKNAAQFAAV